jgi:hypothetical protein
MKKIPKQGKVERVSFQDEIVHEDGGIAQVPSGNLPVQHFNTTNDQFTIF